MEDIFRFLQNNPLFILFPVLFAALMFFKPFRNMTAYCVKNIIPLLFLVILSAACSFFGYTLSLNVFSVASTLLLGLPGISLAIFLSLII